MKERFFPRRKIALYLLLALISVSTLGYTEQASASPKEALMLRRITEYWKDGDYSTVKKQIINFLEKNPDTTLHDHLHAMLGDLYFQERNYRQALATYDLIGSPEIREKTVFNHLQAQFEAREFIAVIEATEKFLKENRASPLESKVRYLLAESCFRHALKCNDREQKIFYLKMAKPQYTVLTQSKYSERVLFPLAEIHRLLRENARAASLYCNLADKYPEHRERFLFQSAILQIKDDKSSAVQAFKDVYEMGGKRCLLAAYNRLILLYQLEDYDTFLTFYDKVIGKMPDQKVPLLQFYEGRCHYSMGDYQLATLPLEKFVEATSGRSKELRTGYLLLVNCSRYLKDISLLERTLYSYKSAFPKDSQVPKVLMIHSQMCRENGDFTQALSDLKTLAQDYPGYEDAEGVMYDCALLLSQNDRWIEARETFLSFLDKHPTSDRKNGAWRNLLNCCIEEIKNPSQANSNVSKENFIKILHKALNEEDVLTRREKQQYSLAMMKCQCELGQYEDALHHLSTYINDVVEDEFLSEAYLLKAICMQKTSSDLSDFIENAETALSYNNRLPERDLLHLELYNAYLSKAQATSDESNRGFYFKHAADNLFSSEAWKQRSVKLDNYLWLANYYYQNSLQGNEEAFTKAQVLFSDLLGVSSKNEPLNISSDSLYLEGEVLKYAHLLALHGKNNDQVTILEKLVNKQKEHSGLPWKLRRRALLDLANAYETNHQYQDALNSYKHLLKSSPKGTSMVTNSALLHLAKLDYRLLKPAQRSSQSPEMISILHTLKDLQIQKKLQAEPLHLEAALQYAEIRASLADPDTQVKDTYFFYKRMFDDFHSENDPIAEEYNHLRESFPDKDAIFGAYMNYVDAKLLKCQMIMARKEGKVEKALEFEEASMNILNNLLKCGDYLQPYLYERVKRAKVEISEQL